MNSSPSRTPPANVLGRLLAASFALLVILGILGAVLGSAALIRIDRATAAAVDQNLAAERIVSEARRLVALNSERYKAMALSSEPGVQEALTVDVHQTERTYRALLQQLRGAALDAKARRQLGEVDAADARFRAAVESLRAAIDTNHVATIQKQYAGQFLPASRGLLDAVDRLATAQRQAIDAAAAMIHRQSIDARWALLAFALAAMVVGALMAAWLATRISKPISFASQTAARVADFDLANDIQGHARDEAGRLLGALSRMQENLRVLVAQVSASAHNMHIAASEMAQGNQDLSQRTEETAGRLERTAAALEQVTRNLHESTRGLAQAKDLAGEAAAEAVAGGRLVVELVERMHGIERGTARVSEIVSLIAGIAFQTNLLALNAAVEAARAGAYGRGFAVVAGEVRHLSQRTAEAAKDVKALVSNSQDSVAAGALLAGQVGEVVARVVRSMQGVAANISQVTIHTESQGVDIADVNVALAQISEATQQNAALVEQSSAASHGLRAQAEALSGQIRRFVLPDTLRAAPLLLVKSETA